MNDHQVKGKVKQAAGAVEQRAGRASGDADVQARGSARKSEGKVQTKVGDVKSGLKKMVRRP